MNLLIFRTDIKTKEKAKSLSPIFNTHPLINDWSVDTEDIDNVLRIEVSKNVNEKDIILLIKTYGFYCEALPD